MLSFYVKSASSTRATSSCCVSAVVTLPHSAVKPPSQTTTSSPGKLKSVGSPRWVRVHDLGQFVSLFIAFIIVLHVLLVITGLNGIRFRRLAGDLWLYKTKFDAIMQRVKL
jgi:hypothetical protein